MIVVLGESAEALLLPKLAIRGRSMQEVRKVLYRAMLTRPSDYLLGCLRLFALLAVGGETTISLLGALRLAEVADDGAAELM